MASLKNCSPGETLDARQVPAERRRDLVSMLAAQRCGVPGRGRSKQERHGERGAQNDSAVAGPFPRERSGVDRLVHATPGLALFDPGLAGHEAPQIILILRLDPLPAAPGHEDAAGLGPAVSEIALVALVSLVGPEQPCEIVRKQSFPGVGPRCCGRRRLGGGGPGDRGSQQRTDYDRERPSGQPVRTIAKIEEFAVYGGTPGPAQAPGYVAAAAEAYQRAQDQKQSGQHRKG